MNDIKTALRNIIREEISKALNEAIVDLPNSENLGAGRYYTLITKGKPFWQKTVPIWFNMNDYKYYAQDKKNPNAKAAISGYDGYVMVNFVPNEGDYRYGGAGYYNEVTKQEHKRPKDYKKMMQYYQNRK
jgi:hypothetical protein